MLRALAGSTFFPFGRQLLGISEVSSEIVFVVRPDNLPATEEFLELPFGQSTKLPGLSEPQNAASVKCQRKFLTHLGFRVRRCET